MSTLDLWTGKFGDEYHQREQTGWKDRCDLWIDVLDYALEIPYDNFSILEVGCGTGENLTAINEECPGVELFGIEPNKIAFDIARRDGPACMLLNDSFENYKEDRKFNLVFTWGVLIHVHPDNLQAFMQKIVDHSSEYVVAVEYFAPEQREVKYRDNNGALWVNDFGKLYMGMGLEIIDCRFYYKELTGLDNVTVWVMKKKGK